MNRLNRTEYFLKIAELVSERSTCTRARVGAVLVDQESNIIAATGYNGSLPGAPHCIDQGCLMHNDHCKRTLHAEMNAVLHLERRYRSLICYSTHQPCSECLKALVLSGVKLIYYLIPYEDIVRDKLLEELEMKPMMVQGRI